MKIAIRRYFNRHGDWIEIDHIIGRWAWYNTNKSNIEGGRKCTKYKLEKIMRQNGFKSNLDHTGKPVEGRSLKKGIKGRVKRQRPEWPCSVGNNR